MEGAGPRASGVPSLPSFFSATSRFVLLSTQEGLVEIVTYKTVSLLHRFFRTAGFPVASFCCSSPLAEYEAIMPNLLAVLERLVT
jgi:hypothetical protein